MDEVSFEYFNQKDRDILKKFIKNNWSSNHIFTKDNIVFDFQYSKNEYTFVIAKSKNKIIGVQGYIDYDKFTKLNNKEIFLAFWCVSSDAPIGVGLRLHKFILNNSMAKFVGIIGINKATHKLHKWLGFQIKKMEHYVMINSNFKKFKLTKLGNYKVKTKKKLTNQVDLIEINKNSLFEIIDNKFYASQKPLKSNQYIKFRYFDHPIYKYKIYLCLIKNIPVSLYVIRILKVKNILIVRIVDFIGLNKYVYTLNTFAEYIIKKFNPEYIDFYFYGIPKSYFSKTSFVDKTKYKNMIIPNYFEPFIFENIELFCGYKDNLGKKNIKIFKGDGDGDRPSIINK
jgi:hypothetical protein